MRWVRVARPCGECNYFIIAPHEHLLGVCKKKLMAVLKNEKVLCKPDDCCFEELDLSKTVDEVIELFKERNGGK